MLSSGQISWIQKKNCKPVRLEDEESSRRHYQIYKMETFMYSTY